jgi:hypothetical protein
MKDNGKTIYKMGLARKFIRVLIIFLMVLKIIPYTKDTLLMVKKKKVALWNSKMAQLIKATSQKIWSTGSVIKKKMIVFWGIYIWDDNRKYTGKWLNG